MKNLPLLLGTIIGTVLLVIGLSYFFSNQPQTGQETQLVDQALLSQGATKVYGSTEEAVEEADVTEDDSMESEAIVEDDSLEAIEASDEAMMTEELNSKPVTVVEFSDFQCPACRAAQSLVKSLLIQNSDQVTFIYRHFPLDSIHPNARLAAQASEAALAQGKFWEYHDLLFETQTEWAEIAGKEELLNYFSQLAEQLELNLEDFNNTIEAPETVAAVQADVDLGTQVGIQATPTFFVNGLSVTAPQLRDAVEELLNQK